MRYISSMVVVLCFFTMTSFGQRVAYNFRSYEKRYMIEGQLKDCAVEFDRYMFTYIEVTPFQSVRFGLFTGKQHEYSNRWEESRVEWGTSKTYTYVVIRPGEFETGDTKVVAYAYFDKNTHRLVDFIALIDYRGLLQSISYKW